MGSEINDILNGKESVDLNPTVEKDEAKAEVETPEEATADKTEEKVENTEEETKVEKPETTAEKESSKQVPLEALMAERTKRQEMSKKLEELERKQLEANKPELTEDPEARLQYEQEVIKGYVDKKMVAMSEELVRTMHPDFDEKIDAFEAEAKENPALIEQMHASGNPALYAYNAGDKAIKMKEFGNVEDYKQQLYAEVKAEILKELKADQDKKESLKKEIPVSTTDVRAASGASSKEEYVATPIKNIIGPKR